MVYILPELLVLIAERSESKSIHSLMLTCKRFHEILRYHERSIVKGRLTAYSSSAIDPRVFRYPDLIKNHPLLHLYGDEDNTVLTSYTDVRTIARAYSYAVIKELETRERRSIDHYACTPANVAASGIAHLSPNDQQRHMDSLARACVVADLIADSAARIVARAGWVDGYNAHLASDTWAPGACGTTLSSCSCNSWGYALTATHFGNHSFGNRHQPARRTTPVDVGPRPSEYDTEATLTKLTCAVRAAQLAIVKGLSQWDLVYLSWLTEMAGVAYSRGAKLALSDPEHLEKRTAFQECVLRRGASLTMWAHDAVERWEEYATRRKYKRQTAEALDDVLWELFLWETGHGTERVRVADAFPAVRGPAVGDPAVWGSALRDPALRDPALRDPAVGDPAVGDPAIKGPMLVGLMEAFDEKIVRANGDERDAEQENEGENEKTVPAMAPGLHMTMVRTLCRKADPEALRAHEKDFVGSM